MIDFETAYSWLNTFNSSCLGEGTRQFVSQLSENLRQERHARLRTLADQLLVLAGEVAYEDEQAECLVVCARVRYRLNDLSGADETLRRAADLYRSNRMTHQSAVVDWLRGWVLWNMPGEEQYLPGLALMEKGTNLFQLLHAVHIAVDRRRRLWYSAKIEAMRHSIQEQMRMLDLRGAEPPGSVPPEPPAQAWQQEYPPEAESAAPRAGDVAPAASTSPAAPPEEPGPIPVDMSGNFLFSLRTFEVRDWIWAGDPKTMNTVEEPLGHLELDRVLFDGQAYQIKPLKKNGNIINLTGYLNNGQRLVALKIKGDSMNRATPHPIQDGDFVLVVMQDHGRDGDIVIAGVRGFDQEATIKRLRVRGRWVELVPETDNPAHEVRRYQKGDAFVILGVALAVFQPV
jgi:hypothetical protein